MQSSIPNIISLARLLSTPILILLIIQQEFVLAVTLFAAAAVSDALDGLLARLFKSRTMLGAYLDPIADKALLIGVYWTLGYKGYIDLWVVIIVIFRDILIIGGILLLFLFKKNIHMAPLLISKINTTAQLIFVGYVLFALAFNFYDNLIVYFGYFVAITTILSGGSYVRIWLKQIQG